MRRTFLFLALMAATALAAPDKFVCYLGSWANYRTGNCRYTIENIDASICTHIIYGFVGINPDASIRIMDAWLDDDSGLGGFRRFTGLKSKNSKLKALVAIGGWNEGSTTFSAVVSNASLRSKFTANAVAFVKKYGFDGFDLDWEYPAQRGGASTDKANFSKLLEEMRTAFNNAGLLLTAAVAACPPSIDTSYDIPQLNKYLDFINVMTYDMHGAWDPVTGHNAPLYPRASETGAAAAFSVDSCIKAWISRGAEAKKLILGTGTYGRTFTLSSSGNNNIGAPISGGGSAGQCTGEMGILGYNEICQKIASGGWTVVWNNEQQIPYAYNGNQWIGYDNERSITLKVDYAKTKGLGGIMVWSLETDDFNGLCGKANILLNTIKTNLGLTGGGTSTTTTTTTTTKSPTTAPVGTICTTAEIVRDPNDCGAFYQCVSNGSGGFIAYRTQCAAGLYFDTVSKTCNYANLVKC
ncbi:Glycosyl hydrolases family 18 [Popillia japonica]|uniref:chitinase n=1 Tax=Popillia japonica TaxID=7064 RepID=A0AAW1JXF2_POPJA